MNQDPQDRDGDDCFAIVGYQKLGCGGCVQLRAQLRESEAQAAAMRGALEDLIREDDCPCETHPVDGDDYYLCYKHRSLESTAGKALLEEMEQLRKERDDWRVKYEELKK